MDRIRGIVTDSESPGKGPGWFDRLAGLFSPILWICTAAMGSAVLLATDEERPFMAAALAAASIMGFGYYLGERDRD